MVGENVSTAVGLLAAAADTVTDCVAEPDVLESLVVKVALQAMLVVLTI